MSADAPQANPGASDEALFVPPGDRHYSPEEVHALLTARITHLLEERRAWLLGKLYRLDVRERDLKAALASASEVPAALATLVMERQVERAEVKTRVRVEPIDDGDLRW